MGAVLVFTHGLLCVTVRPTRDSKIAFDLDLRTMFSSSSPSSSLDENDAANDPLIFTAATLVLTV